MVYLILLLIPVWIFVWSAAVGAALELTTGYEAWWRVPLWMAFMLPWVGVGIAGLAGIVLLCIYAGG